MHKREIMKDPFQLVPLKNEELAEFKREMQKAFQLGYEQEFGPCKEAVLPEEDIDRSLNSKGAFAYAARIYGELAGGAIVVIDTNSGHNHLDLLFVKSGTQSKGVGQAIWEKSNRNIPIPESGKHAHRTLKNETSIFMSTGADFTLWNFSIRITIFRLRTRNTTEA